MAIRSRLPLLLLLLLALPVCLAAATIDPTWLPGTWEEVPLDEHRGQAIRQGRMVIVRKDDIPTSADVTMQSRDDAGIVVRDLAAPGIAKLMAMRFTVAFAESDQPALPLLLLTESVNSAVPTEAIAIAEETNQRRILQFQATLQWSGGHLLTIKDTTLFTDGSGRPNTITTRIYRKSAARAVP